MCICPYLLVCLYAYALICLWAFACMCFCTHALMRRDAFCSYGSMPARVYASMPDMLLCLFAYVLICDIPICPYARALMLYCSCARVLSSSYASVLA